MSTSDYICEHCGEIKFYPSHRCPPVFLWTDDWEYIRDGRGNWSKVYARDMQEAAEKAAAKQWHYESPNEYSIFISADGGVTATEFHITVEFAPSFTAAEGDAVQVEPVAEEEAEEETPPTNPS